MDTVSKRLLGEVARVRRRPGPNLAIALRSGDLGALISKSVAAAKNLTLHYGPIPLPVVAEFNARRVVPPRGGTSSPGMLGELGRVWTVGPRRSVRYDLHTLNGVEPSTQGRTSACWHRLWVQVEAPFLRYLMGCRLINGNRGP